MNYGTPGKISWRYKEIIKGKDQHANLHNLTVFSLKQLTGNFDSSPEPLQPLITLTSPNFTFPAISKKD